MNNFLEITGNDVVDSGVIKVYFSSMDMRSPLSFTFIREGKEMSFSVHRENIRELAKFLLDQII